MRTGTRFAFMAMIGIAVAFMAVRLLRFSVGVTAASTGILLTGMVKSDHGEKMAGVTVSAKADGSTITTTVFTDDDGKFYFPRLPEGQYRVWAQATGYDAGRARIPMAVSAQHQNFTLKAVDDVAPQLTGDQWLASLPEDTRENRRMKEVLRMDCVGCHTPAFALQNRFDEKGWTAILNLMSRETAVGRPPLNLDEPPMPAVNYFKPEFAAYLAKMRGPGRSPIKFKLRPRPTGEAALAVITEYDVPLPEGGYPVQDGSDWSAGTPARSWHLHDAQIDFNGNLWFTDWDLNMDRTIAKIDAKTGDVENFKVPGANGFAASSHAIIRDSDGVLWFNVRMGGAEGSKSALGRLDPKVEKVEVFPTPAGMPGVGSFLDYDGKGKVWMAGGTGVLRFDPTTHKFTQFKSPIRGSDVGNAGLYGVMGDREGNGWWSQYSSDMEAKADYETGEVQEVKLPRRPETAGLFTDQERKVFQAEGESGFFWGVPWGDGPRRPGADKNGDAVWIPGWWSDQLMKIDIHTLKVTQYPMPTRDAGPYMAQVDKDHIVWIDYQNSETITKFDPKTEKWIEYSLPTIGFDTHQIGVFDHDGPTQIALASLRTSKAARVQFRTQDDMRSLKTEAR